MKSKNIYLVPKEKNMNVPGIVYASEKLLEKIKQDKTLMQIKNVSSLPGIIKNSIALPDAHQGYGFCIGCVAAFDMKTGIISPGGVGYDINCGVRLLKTNLTKDDIDKEKIKILKKLSDKIPSGVGKGSPFQISKKQLDEILEKGANWMIEKGYGTKDDLEFCEENGCLKSDKKDVSDKAKKRGIGQMGTLGAGNHFLEIQYVDELFDKKFTEIFGLKKNQIVILIHCGSRGLGHQVASDYIKEMEKDIPLTLPDRELIYAPINSVIGKKYFSAMNCAANFAFANRQLITHKIRESFKEIFPNSNIELIYDVCHNIAKIEEYVIQGKKKKLCVHRKGATRSFGGGRKEVPKKYREIGQPVLIPGSMGTASYLLLGTKESEKQTFGSSAHGAGRQLSRMESIKKFSGKEIKNNLLKKGILIQAMTEKGLSEEAPESYKDIEEIIKILIEEKLNKKVAKLKPLIVLKG